MSNAISGAVGALYVQTSTSPTTFTDEATTADAGRTRYTITDTDKRYWSDDTVTVKKNTVVQSSGFTIERPGGVVVFDAALDPGDVVTVSGKYHTVAEAATVYNWSVDPSAEEFDDTTFKSAKDSGGWKSFLALLLGWSFGAEAYFATDGSLFSAVDGRVKVFVVLYFDAVTSEARLEGTAVMNSDAISNDVAGVVEESIGGVGTGELFYRTG